VAGAAAAAAVVVIVALTADRRGLSLAAWLGSGIKAGRAWSPSDSWVTNIAGTGAVLGAVVSSLSSLATVISAASVLGVTILFVVFGGAAAFAPLLYAVTAVGSPGAAPDKLTGRVGGFLLAGATSLMAALGETATVALLFWQVDASAVDRVVILVVLCAGGLAVAAYSIRTLLALASSTVSSKAGAHDVGFADNRGTESMLGSTSPSATL
jgi:hypothetical protein